MMKVLPLSAAPYNIMLFLLLLLLLFLLCVDEEINYIEKRVAPIKLIGSMTIASPDDAIGGALMTGNSTSCSSSPHIPVFYIISHFRLPQLTLFLLHIKFRDQRAVEVKCDES